MRHDMRTEAEKRQNRRWCVEPDAYCLRGQGIGFPEVTHRIRP